MYERMCVRGAEGCVCMRGCACACMCIRACCVKVRVSLTYSHNMHMHIHMTYTKNTMQPHKTSCTHPRAR